jgi:hypothetical protein
MKDQEKLRIVLQFLALDNREKSSLLQNIPLGKKLRIYETSIKSSNALFCVGYECFACLERNAFGADDKFRILYEMAGLMDSMITHERGIWMWGVVIPGLSGSPHLFWAILKRLAKEALKLHDWPEALPDRFGDDFITVGEWITSKEQNSRKRAKS